MSRTEALAFIGIGLTLWTLIRSERSQTPILRPTQDWYGAGVDPFNYSYSVNDKAVRGGLR